MIYYILSILGISPWEYLHWLIAIAITLLLLDIFLQVEIPSFLAIILLADYINSLLFLFLPIQWYIVSYIIILILMSALYLCFWKKIISLFLTKTLLRNTIRESNYEGEGKKGTFRSINGTEFVLFDGKLWQVDYDNAFTFCNKEDVLIIKNTNGILTITKNKE